MKDKETGLMKRKYNVVTNEKYCRCRNGFIEGIQKGVVELILMKVR